MQKCETVKIPELVHQLQQTFHKICEVCDRAKALEKKTVGGGRKECGLKPQ